MLRAVQWQFVAALTAVCLGAWLAGFRGAVSAVLASMAVLIPSCWFAIRLTVLVKRGKASPITFLLGEFVKIMATVILLAFIAKLWTDVHWPMLLLGVIMVSQANLWAFWKKT